MKKPFQDPSDGSLQKAWTDALASLHGLEEEMGRRLRQLKERADVHQSAEEIQRIIAELGRRLQETSEALERRLEESVRSVCSRLRAPLADELARLKARVEQLQRRIESQLLRRRETPEASKPVEPDHGSNPDAAGK